ncbi:hypothetical protein PHMEG_0004381 [Phytophthora megakarya]|uniref:Uncharacterized protein n=1 Tax=Phytophthora megakarya TaxID=4795 RepID=A0A225WW54_9STRA|nr:hypothetical protein PHMEG_0004381 [Phytophthora megakarya]
MQYVSDIFSVRTLQRWYDLFLSNGVVKDNDEGARSSRWPCDAVVCM